jgi:glycosyltransferase involved in cell wall biosynthesis
MTKTEEQDGIVSIIMPVKNTELYLHACIQSILQQSYLNWELLAIDDHSTDSSHAILTSYAQTDSRIHIIRNEGVGVIDALRTGYKHARGEFITRMDSDDINALHKYEHMVSQLKLNGKGHLALGQVTYFAEGGIGNGFQNYETWMNALIAKGTCFDEVYRECVIPSPCWMLYRTDFDAIGGFNVTQYPEDYDLCFRMYHKGMKPIPCKERLLYWRDYPNRTTRVVSHYQGDALIRLKCHHFLDIDYSPKKSLVVWGAGHRGKFIAKYLVEHNIPFTWICNNENKIGHTIYNQVLKSTSSLVDLNHKQILVSVANISEQADIKSTCEYNDWEAYFFC